MTNLGFEHVKWNTNLQIINTAFQTQTVWFPAQHNSFMLIQCALMAPMASTCSYFLGVCAPLFYNHPKLPHNPLDRNTVFIDRYQLGVPCPSPPYLVTLLHPTPLWFQTGMSNRDMRVDRKRQMKMKTERKNTARGVISVLSPNLSCHLTKSDSYGLRRRDIITVDELGRRGVICVCLVGF